MFCSRLAVVARREARTSIAWHMTQVAHGPSADTLCRVLAASSPHPPSQEPIAQDATAACQELQAPRRTLRTAALCPALIIILAGRHSAVAASEASAATVGTIVGVTAGDGLRATPQERP